MNSDEQLSKTPDYRAAQRMLTTPYTTTEAQAARIVAQSNLAIAEAIHLLAYQLQLSGLDDQQRRAALNWPSR